MNDHRKTRSLLMQTAIRTAIGGKAAGFLLQLVALPFAAKALGPSLFGVYSAATGLASVLSLANFGLGSNLTREVAVASANQDYAASQKAISQCILLNSLLSLVFLVPLFAEVASGNLPEILGEGYRDYSDELQIAAFAALGVSFMQIALTPFIRALAGLQRGYWQNIAVGVASLVSCGMIFMALHGNEISAKGLVWMMWGPAVLANLVVSALGLITFKEIRPSLQSLSLSHTKAFFGQALWFGLAFTLLPWLQREGLRFLVARFYGPEGTGTISVFLHLSLTLGGFFTVFTVPLLAAAAEANERRDIAWVRLWLNRCRLLVVVVFAAGLLLGPLFGVKLLGMWFGETFAFSTPLIIAFCLWFSVSMWAHVHTILTCALGGAKAVVLIVGLEVLIGLSASALLAQRWGLPGALYGMAIGGLSTTAWMLFLKLNKIIGERATSAS